MRLVGAELIESREILPGQWLQSYHAPALATGSRAGQFVHVRTGDLSGLVLRRPFSINTADQATGTITIHFRTIGRGTEWFTRLRSGDTIDMLGPLGRPFEVDPRSRHLLLIAGGLGVAKLGRKRGAGKVDAPSSPAARRKAFLQVSMEQRMGCAVGACLGCVVMTTSGTPQRVCREGPVFASEEIDWEGGWGR